MLVEEVIVAYSVNLKRGMNGFLMLMLQLLLLLMVRLVQRLKHQTVHELLLWLLGGSLPRQGRRGKNCASLQKRLGV